MRSKGPGAPAMKPSRNPVRSISANKGLEIENKGRPNDVRQQQRVGSPLKAAPSYGKKEKKSNRGKPKLTLCLCKQNSRKHE